MSNIELKKLPQHIAFIIDGNGRWAKSRGLPRTLGHKAGFETLKKITKECFYNYKIPIVSIYAFSTENWNRPQKEIDYLIDLFEDYTSEKFVKDYPGVKLNVMGDYTKFPDRVVRNVEACMETTKDNKLIFNLGINYSGQDELVYAINGIINDGHKSVTREVVEEYLYTAGQPPVDFCVRTSGEYRLSNFMLWQLAYAELYFPKVKWPGFNRKHLKDSLIEYQSRDRRFGSIKE
ncbi:MAG: di-trans,poly-cis-decaprenylcistransferase [Clostridiales bacterium]|nr:di-trans,poly-cis-decaprenylcistransferase [Clostridiales bacterium]